jgi:hypothetical protein
MFPISGVQTPTQVIFRGKRKERHAAIPVFRNNSSVKSNQRPGDSKVPHAEMVARSMRHWFSQLIVHLLFTCALDLPLGCFLKCEISEKTPENR